MGDKSPGLDSFVFCREKERAHLIRGRPFRDFSGGDSHRSHLLIIE
jgi:hypothetical protein